MASFYEDTVVVLPLLFSSPHSIFAWWPSQGQTGLSGPLDWILGGDWIVPRLGGFLLAFGKDRQQLRGRGFGFREPFFSLVAEPGGLDGGFRPRDGQLCSCSSGDGVQVPIGSRIR